MIYCEFIEPVDEPEKSWFEGWKKKAAAETAIAIETHKDPKKLYEFKSAIWGELKDYLKKLFHGKCAYCEASFVAVAWGDMEHYRPKGKVTDEDNKPVSIREGQNHPGYYWLAYDPKNLFPSCQLCNQGQGKMNKFPIEGKRACCPTDNLEDETALLLNPYQHIPRKHLKFIPKVGTVVGVDKIGEASVRVYNLNREPLNEARRREQEAGRLRALKAYSDDDPMKFPRLLEELKGSNQPFSAAVVADVRDFFVERAAALEALRLARDSR